MPISATHPIIACSNNYKSNLSLSYALPAIPEQSPHELHPLSPKIAPVDAPQQPSEFNIASDAPSECEGNVSSSEGITISNTTANQKYSNYQSKLSTKRMIIFDWDDTLFPTTTTVTNQIELTLTELYTFGAKLYKLLTTYIDSFGGDNIYIITNGGDGWIQYSLNQSSSRFQELVNQKYNGSPSDKKEVSPKMKDYFKSILAIFKIYRIRTISARHLYGHQYPGETTRWKELAFAYYAYHHFYSDGLEDNNIIISIGDSCDEWIASKDTLLYLQRQAYENKIPVYFNLQRIKLREKPSLKYLMNEWDDIIKMTNNKTGKIKSRFGSFDDNCQEFEHGQDQIHDEIKNDVVMNKNKIKRKRILRIRASINIYK